MGQVPEMEISTFIVTYSSMWCVIFLLALPILAGKADGEKSQPVTIMKLICVSLISLPVTFAIIYLISYAVEQ